MNPAHRRFPKAALRVVQYALAAAVFLAVVCVGGRGWVCPETPHTRQEDARSTVEILATLANVHREQTGRLPTGVRDLEALGRFDNQPLDPWGHPFRYWVLFDTPVFASLGADNRCGGDGDAADVLSQSATLVLEDCVRRAR